VWGGSPLLLYNCDREEEGTTQNARHGPIFMVLPVRKSPCFEISQNGRDDC
jgi:hypothetical protein